LGVSDQKISAKLLDYKKGMCRKIKKIKVRV